MRRLGRICLAVLERTQAMPGNGVVTMHTYGRHAGASMASARRLFGVTLTRSQDGVADALHMALWGLRVYTAKRREQA